MVDLLKKRVSIVDPLILQFFYPHFHLLQDFTQPVDYTDGVIFTGQVNDSVIRKLDTVTRGKYILSTKLGEIVLQQPSDFIREFFPALSDKAESYNAYSLEQFLPMFKQYYLLQKRPPLLKEEESNLFTLFKSLTGSKTDLDRIYFTTLSVTPVNVLSSSILTFLLKVKAQNYTGASASYKKIINSSYLKFASKIKPAIKQYIESSQKTEIALWLLLDTLNG